jgi:hypothetical protein
MSSNLPPRARPPGRWRRWALRLALLVALAQPTAAWPLTLQQLLALPLEQLLRIEFTPSGASR